MSRFSNNFFPFDLFSERQTSLVDIPGLIQRESHDTKAVSTASSSARNEPPRLTQTLPVMNSVNVPKPIPLVQSNVVGMLPGSNAVGHIPNQVQILYSIFCD